MIQKATSALDLKIQLYFLQFFSSSSFDQIGNCQWYYDVRKTCKHDAEHCIRTINWIRLIYRFLENIMFKSNRNWTKYHEQLLIILNIRTPGDGFENKSFSEEVIFVGELSCGTLHIFRHGYDGLGIMFRICCLPLFANWRVYYLLLICRLTIASVVVLILLLEHPSDLYLSSQVKPSQFHWSWYARPRLAPYRMSGDHNNKIVR